jgi:hypothetical protein
MQKQLTDEPKLTAAQMKRPRFAELRHAHPELPGSEVAIKAGYSPATAKVKASQLMRDPVVQQRLRELDAKQTTTVVDMAAKPIVEADAVLRGILGYAESDPAEMFDPETGRLLHPRDMPEHVRKSIASIEVKRTRTISDEHETVVEEIVKVRLWNKPAGHQMLARHLGLLDGGKAHAGSDDWIEQLVDEYKQHLIRLRDDPDSVWLKFRPADQLDLSHPALRGLSPHERWLKRRAMRKQGEESQPHQQQRLESPN